MQLAKAEEGQKLDLSMDCMWLNNGPPPRFCGKSRNIVLFLHSLPQQFELAV